MEFAKKLVERTGKPYLSYSALKYAADGGKQQDMKLFELYVRGLLKKSSPALTFGSLYDMMLLEPKRVNDSFFVLDDSAILQELSGEYKNPKASKKYKDWASSQVSDGRTQVTGDDWQMAEDMINRLNASEVLNPDTGEVLPVRSFLKGEAQVEFNTWIDEIPVRGFFDVKGDGFVTDSKSTRSVYGFPFDVKSFDYDIQAYIYTQVAETDTFYWVAQGKTKPYLTAVYKASPKILASGERKFWSAINNITRWLDDPTKATDSFAIYREI